MPEPNMQIKGLNKEKFRRKAAGTANLATAENYGFSKKQRSAGDWEGDFIIQF